MKVKIANEQIRGLTQPQKLRLKQYHTSLSTDKDIVLFDDNLEELLLKFGKDKRFITQVTEHLRTIGFTQAAYKYEHLEVALEKFKQRNHPSFVWNNNYKTAKQKLIDEFSRMDLRTLKYDSKDEIERAIPKLDTHAGFSFIFTGKRKKGEYVEDLLANYIAMETRAIQEGSFNAAILVGSRTQAKGFLDEVGTLRNVFECKTRFVSMVDVYQILAESKFARPVQKYLSSVRWYAGGKDDATIMGIISSWRHEYKHRVTIDYSAYDQSISDWLIREAFDVMRVAFRNDVLFDEVVFKIVREDLISKVFIDGKGEAVQSEKGVPSGSMFTQLVDSIVNKLIIETYLTAFPHGSHQYMIMGDDNIIFTDSEIDLVHLSSYIRKNFGISAHPDKCSKSLSSETPEFLSRYWRYEGIWREPKELIAKICYPERYRDYNYADPLMILYAYVLSFPKGMEEFLNVSDIVKEVSSVDFRLRDNGKWLTGLMKYRAHLLYG